MQQAPSIANVQVQREFARLANSRRQAGTHLPKHARGGGGTKGGGVLSKRGRLLAKRGGGGRPKRAGAGPKACRARSVGSGVTTARAAGPANRAGSQAGERGGL